MKIETVKKKTKKKKEAISKALDIIMESSMWKGTRESFIDMIIELLR